VESFGDARSALLHGSPWVLGALTARLAVRAWDPKGRVWPWLVAALSVPVSVYCFCLGGLGLHAAYGTAFTHGRSCSHPPIEAETCLGRDHSFLQARFRYARMSGRIDPAVCAAFRRAVPRSPASAIDGRGWPRCVLTRPATWIEVDCRAAGEVGADACYLCSGRSSTTDDYYTLVSFASSCAKARVFDGVNVPPHAYEACLDDPESPACIDPWGGGYTPARLYPLAEPR
jgi:hypothetical protein